MGSSGIIGSVTFFGSYVAFGKLAEFLAVKWKLYTWQKLIKYGFSGMVAAAAMGYAAQKWFFGYGPAHGAEGMAKNVAMVQAVREAVGPDFIVIYRLSMIDLVPNGSTWEEVVQLAKAIEATKAYVKLSHDVGGTGVLVGAGADVLVGTGVLVSAGTGVLVGSGVLVGKGVFVGTGPPPEIRTSSIPASTRLPLPASAASIRIRTDCPANPFRLALDDSQTAESVLPAPSS